jgi:hypothetical protein
MIWLLARPTPPPPTPVSQFTRRNTGRLRKRDNLLIEAGEEWVGEEPNQESLVHKSFSLSERVIIPIQSLRVSSAWTVLLDFYLHKKVFASRCFYAAHGIDARVAQFSASP